MKNKLSRKWKIICLENKLSDKNYTKKIIAYNLQVIFYFTKTQANELNIKSNKIIFLRKNKKTNYKNE